MPPALPVEMVPMLLSTGASARSTDAVAARFRAGDAVVARNINPVGHTRLPRYIKGKRGVIRADHGVFTFPDTTAHGQGHKPQHLYSVRFMARELWGDEASPRDSVFIDLFDDYMDADPAAAAGDEPAGAQVRPLGSRTSRRAARPERSGGARKKPRKARRPGVRVQKAATRSQAAVPARASRKTATAKKKSIKKRASAKARKSPRAAMPTKPARVRKKARAARS